MPVNLARVRTVVLEVPRNAKLAYCLLRDDRVPVAPKAALTGALALIVGPIDVPAWIPVIGELDMLALAVLAVKVFIEACPEELVQEQRAAMKRKDSIADRDLRLLRDLLTREAQAAVRRVFLRRRGGGRRKAPRVLEDQRI
ncbi:MAG: hypothetical protein DLM67_03350 [Candidatus Nephthysia bennettiae]|uniref:DUF1232 domain-containing protein n=1 Tax=Candidatus Nephthysia bennettiae TaxID=3127016 RepID=A0A934N3T8_9BACT|nr:hypothetical protein [Candidatus Dormibacteraeota bacterium]MBJ7614103.1 hypothetical protein [Candidatus Dormibacteraeota bacterium]PZR99594.1 MAG: hypothetical protein DLM67_03350 [Candidatus Dormibacteraeota bacterium]